MSEVSGPGARTKSDSLWDVRVDTLDKRTRLRVGERASVQLRKRPFGAKRPERPSWVSCVEKLVDDRSSEVFGGASYP